MNTRGLVELVVVNLGYDMRVIPKSVFCMLVLMALVTTVMTTPAINATDARHGIGAVHPGLGFLKSRSEEEEFPLPLGEG